MRLTIVGAVLVLAACSDPSETKIPPPQEPSNSCAAGEWRGDDDRCHPAGLPPDLACPPGEVETNGGCRPAGPSACAMGFEADDDGCTPILPTTPCPAGTMALMGETRCRDVAPCRTARWGDAPVAGDTQFVDQNYPGTDSDGTETKPWKTVQEGVNAAQPGAVVAVAAGEYVENLVVTLKPVTIWGRCPALVSIAGVNLASVRITASAGGSELHDLAITGPHTGVLAFADAALDRVWIHDTGSDGALVEAGRLIVVGSLIERATLLGIEVFGAELEVDSSVVRDTQPESLGIGRGIELAPENVRTRLDLRRSLVERNSQVGVFAGSSDAFVEDSVVRDTLAADDGVGRGIGAEDLSGEPAYLEVSGSVIARNVDAGIFGIGSDIVVTETVVRDSVSNSLSGRSGRGIWVQVNSDTGGPASLTVSSSTVLRNQDSGITTASAPVSIDGSRVSDNLPRDDDGIGGLGVHAVYAPGVGPPPEISISASRFDGNHLVGVLGLDAIMDVKNTAICGTLVNTMYDARGIGLERLEADAPRGRTRIESSLLCDTYGSGLYALDAEVEVVTSEIRATRPGVSGQSGFGVTLVGAAVGELFGTSVSDSRVAGIVLEDSEVSLDGVAVRDTHVRESDGTFGDGIAVLVDAKPASASIHATLIQNSERAAVLSFGGEVTLAQSRLDCYLIPLDGEQSTSRFRFEDLGDNWCGCGDVTETCAVRSSNLQPPAPPEFAEPP